MILSFHLQLPTINPPQPEPVHYTGYAAHYSPGLMAKVAKNRGIEPYDCMISSPLFPLETIVIVKSLSNDVELECKVVDQSHPRDKERHINNRLWAEVDFGSAKKLFDIKKVGQKPNRDCPIEIWKKP